ncbi:GNAT family N-acetyltransferase [Oscillatoria sp. FACHB-1407]|uniref:GNAT family N-acetyltransferase n=1 Tax=Oscillatoria sp. FACHB-1407 TaxID=2692847 RepID=UPI0018EF56BC|nr:GNAT family N-acetyltransferase [Oscillatoria sp. FACHB-1407]
MLDDAPIVQQLAGDRDIAAMTLSIPHPYPLHVAEEWIKTHAARFEQGTEVNYAIVLQNQNRLCGAIGLGIDPVNRHAELGYWIGKPNWGKGICTEAGEAILQYGFEQLELHRIHSTHFACNPASGRVMQKIGMHQEGYRPQYFLKWGEFKDIVQYGIVKRDWQA